jgi:hypothetical protein
MQPKVECPWCHAFLKVSRKLAGKTVKCPKCNQPVEVPPQDAKIQSDEFLDIDIPVDVPSQDVYDVAIPAPLRENEVATQVVIACNWCGSPNTLVLSESRRECSCAECDGVIFVPTLKQYRYNLKVERMQVAETNWWKGLILTTVGVIFAMCVLFAVFGPSKSPYDKGHEFGKYAREHGMDAAMEKYSGKAGYNFKPGSSEWGEMLEGTLDGKDGNPKKRK